jgi:hypothetical protein
MRKRVLKGTATWYKPSQRKWRLVIRWTNPPSSRDLQCLQLFGSVTSNNHTILQRRGRAIMLTLRNAEWASVENQWKAQEDRAVAKIRAKRREPSKSFTPLS